MTCTGLKKHALSLLHLLYLKNGIKKIPEFLHVVDNSEKEKEENKGDKCFKVKPLLRAVTNNYIKIQSIDEPIITAKTKKVAD